MQPCQPSDTSRTIRASRTPWCLCLCPSFLGSLVGPPRPRWHSPADAVGTRAAHPQTRPLASHQKNLSRSTWLRISEPRASPQIVMGPAVAAAHSRNKTRPNCVYNCAAANLRRVWCMYLHTREHDALLQPALPTILHRPTAPSVRSTEEGPSYRSITASLATAHRDPKNL